jgi:RNA polymerase sigma factor (sigma-70 family)
VNLSEVHADSEPEAGRMPVTCWTLVLAAAGSDGDRAAAAMADIYRAYWRPLYRYLRCQGQDHHAAEDLINGLFADLTSPEHHWFAQPDRAKGRFRSFLLNALKFHLSNEHRRQASIKRGGAHHRISIDADAEGRALAESLEDPTTPEAEYDQAWKVELTRRALQRLEREQLRGGRGEVFQALVQHLVHGTDANYRELGRRLGLSEGAVATTISRLRQRLRVLLEAEVAETVDAPEQVQIEMQELFGLAPARPVAPPPRRTSDPHNPPKP